MRAAGRPQEDVAELLGWARQAVHKPERYDSDLKLPTLRCYANVPLGTDRDCAVGHGFRAEGQA